MKMEIICERENPLYNRKEVRFVVDHERESTPGRNAVAEELAKKYNTQRVRVVIDELAGEYGVGKTKGYAKIYANKKAALDCEEEHLLKRNGIAAEEKKEEEAPAAE